VLLAAHGERRAGSGNEGVAQLAARLGALDAAPAIGFGFLKGSPSIGDAVARLSSPDLVVYPLFLSDGYFTQTLLPDRLREAGAFGRGRALQLLPPLGCDPALVNLVLDRARAVAQAQGWPPPLARVVVLAHGSSNNPASRLAAARMVAHLAMTRIFAGVGAAFLEEPPYLKEAVRHTQTPCVVVGLFAGEGLHGGKDAPELVAELARADVVFAGNLGGFAGLADVIAAAIQRARSAARVRRPSICR
jgi:sirohydrochlorin ferrochelatase